MSSSTSSPSFLIASQLHQDTTKAVCSFPLTIGGTKMTLMGYSRAADQTFFYIPDLKWGLDAGRCYQGKQPEFVFLTHSHIDHCKDIGYMATREHGVKIFAPMESVARIDKYIKAEIEMNTNTDWKEEKKKYELVGVKGGDVFDLGRRNFQVSVVQCIHSVPSVGYCFEEKRVKLKKEFQNLATSEIVNLKRQNSEQIFETVTVPLFVYMGDTHASFFTQRTEEGDHVLRFPVVILECTFLDTDAELLDRAERNGHVHWSTLKEVVMSHPLTTFMLTHFSLRYQNAEVISFFSKEDGCLKTEGKSLANVVLLLSPL